ARLPGRELRVEGAATEIAREGGLFGSSSVERVSVQLAPSPVAEAALASWDGIAPSMAAHAEAEHAPAANAVAPLGIVRGDPWVKLSSLHARLGGLLARFERGVTLE